MLYQDGIERARDARPQIGWRLVSGDMSQQRRVREDWSSALGPGARPGGATDAHYDVPPVRADSQLPGIEKHACEGDPI